MIGIKANNLLKLQLRMALYSLPTFTLLPNTVFSVHQQCIKSFKSSADNLHYHVVIQQVSAVDLIGIYALCMKGSNASSLLHENFIQLRTVLYRTF